MSNSLASPSRVGIEARIFVVGVPRSGTTLVQSLLAAHTAVASWTESHFFSRHFRPLPGLAGRALLVSDPTPTVRQFMLENQVRPPDHLERRVGDLVRRPFGFWPLMFWQSAPVARRLLTILDEMASLQECAVWVEKTPAHLLHVPFLERIAGPGAHLRVVHMVRNGLDTVASLHRASAHWERHYGLGECVARWNAEMRFSLSRRRTSSDLFVFYEDLLRDPEATLRRLLKQLELPWQEDLFDRRGEVSVRLTAPGERNWKADFERAIGPSRAAEHTLTEAQRRRVLKGLDHDLYRDLYQLCEGRIVDPAPSNS